MLHCADLFCGAGGTTSGLLLAAERRRLPVELLAINHWQTAIDTHLLNHPSVRHLCETLDSVDPRKVIPGGRLDLLCASPECTHHSRARGGKPCSDQSRATAWHVLRWADALRVDSVLVENVPEFEDWGPLTGKGKPIASKRGTIFRAWVAGLEALGYRVEWRVLNAADYGDATKRHRLFVQARRAGAIRWPEATHAGHWRPARAIIDWSQKGRSIFGRKRPLAPNTLRRIESGLRKFCDDGVARAFLMHLTHGRDAGRCHSVDQPVPTITGAHRGEMALIQPFLISLRGTSPRQLEATAGSLDEPLPTISAGGIHAGLVQPFLTKYYGTGAAVPVTEPLDTLTTKPRFGLVEPIASGHKLDILFRMLQPEELAGAMGFPTGYQFTGTKEQRIRQIGNAVPVQTAAALCGCLIES